MLREHERLDYLTKEHLRIIQNDAVFSFSTDALLLAHYTTVRKNDKVMDLCSGNGVIPLLLSAKSTQSIEGIEIQSQLVDMAERSYHYNQLSDRLTMHHMDLREVATHFKPAQYSLITCNPPYFKMNQQHQHHKEAHKIARHEVMCTLDDCCKAARHLLKEGGRFIMVHRADRLMDVLTTMRQYRLEPKRLTLIYSKPGKSAQMMIVESRRGGQQGLEIAPPFYIYTATDEYTEEMRAIYYG